MFLDKLFSDLRDVLKQHMDFDNMNESQKERYQRVEAINMAQCLPLVHEDCVDECRTGVKIY